MPAFGGSHREEAEGISIQAVELPLLAETLDDGLSPGESLVGILIG